MFQNIDKNIAYLKGSYKKLKSYYYYNKSMFFIRRKIALFENSQDFETTFSVLANFLCDPRENSKYFKKLPCQDRC